MLNPNNGELATNIPYFSTSITNIDIIEGPQLKFQPVSSSLKQSLQEVYPSKDKLPKIVDDEDIPEQKLENTYVNLMLINKEEKTKSKTEDTKGKSDESKRNDYEDIVASKEEIELKKIFEIKHTDKKEQASLINQVRYRPLVYIRKIIKEEFI